MSQKSGPSLYVYASCQPHIVSIYADGGIGMRLYILLYNASACVVAHLLIRVRASELPER